jgi:hypothetical protein
MGGVGARRSKVCPESHEMIPWEVTLVGKVRGEAEGWL